MPRFLSKKLLKGNVVRARQICENNKINKQASQNNMHTKSSSTNFLIHNLCCVQNVILTANSELVFPMMLSSQAGLFITLH